MKEEGKIGGIKSYCSFVIAHIIVVHIGLSPAGIIRSEQGVLFASLEIPFPFNSPQFLPWLIKFLSLDLKFLSGSPALYLWKACNTSLISYSVS